MTVLHVYSGNLFGGIESILVALARHRHACPDMEADVALCFEGRLSRELLDAGTAVHQLGEVRVSRPQTVSRARRRLAQLIGSRSYDVVVLHAPWAHALFAPVVRKRGLPIALWVHDLWTGRHWTERWARRTRPDALICNSRFTESAAAAAFPGLPAVVVYAPVAGPRSQSTPDERRVVRRELETSDSAVVVVQASRLEPWKGHKLLIDALALLEQRDWIWWQIGGPQRPREAAYLESLRERAQRRGIAARVRFAGQRDDVARILAAADVHCQPNIEPEPFGVAFVEALSAGLPVVTTSVGGAVEIVDDTCGCLVPPGDPQALASALSLLLGDSALRSSLGSQAPARARALCDPDAQTLKFGEVLAGVARKPPSCLQR
jgi:glycosyltransferase involved in cell wall biosynthesis